MSILAAVATVRSMIELFTFGSTNGHKIAIALALEDQHTDRAAWFARVGARPAVVRGVTLPSALPALPPRKRA
jgi:hypothetical protein